MKPILASVTPNVESAEKNGDFKSTLSINKLTTLSLQLLWNPFTERERKKEILLL